MVYSVAKTCRLLHQRTLGVQQQGSILQQGGVIYFSDKATTESCWISMGHCHTERRAAGNLLCAGCEGCSSDPVVNTLDKSVCHSQAQLN